MSTRWRHCILEWHCGWCWLQHLWHKVRQQRIKGDVLFFPQGTTGQMLSRHKHLRVKHLIITMTLTPAVKSAALHSTKMQRVITFCSQVQQPHLLRMWGASPRCVQNRLKRPQRSFKSCERVHHHSSTVSLMVVVSISSHSAVRLLDE